MDSGASLKISLTAYMPECENDTIFVFSEAVTQLNIPQGDINQSINSKRHLINELFGTYRG